MHKQDTMKWHYLIVLLFTLFINTTLLTGFQLSNNSSNFVIEQKWNTHIQILVINTLFFFALMLNTKWPKKKTVIAFWCHLVGGHVHR